MNVHIYNTGRFHLSFNVNKNEKTRGDVNENEKTREHHCVDSINARVKCRG